MLPYRSITARLAKTKQPLSSNVGCLLRGTGSSPGSGVSRSQGSVAAKTKGNEACGASTLPTKKAGCS